MENTDKNILQWEEMFNKYCELELKCVNNINGILEIKNNLKKLLGNQKKDDILFYKSLIDNSQISAIFFSPIVTARTSGFSRAPSQVPQGTSRMYDS
jgi:hypothetical protein